MNKLFSFCIVLIGLLWCVACISSKKTSTATALVANKVDTILPSGYCIWYDTSYLTQQSSHSSWSRKVIAAIYKIEGWYKNGRRIGKWKISQNGVVWKKVIFDNRENIRKVEYLYADSLPQKTVVLFSDDFYSTEYDRIGNQISPEKVICTSQLLSTFSVFY